MMRKLFMMIIACAALPLVAAASTTIHPISIVSTTPSPTSFRVSYQYSEQPHPAHQFYAWVGDWSQAPSSWNRNTLLTSITPSTPVPFNFAVDFNYAQYGLVAGKTYGYVIADRSTVLDAQLFAVPGQDPFRCFVVGTGTVPCPPSGSGNPSGGTQAGPTNNSGQSPSNQCPDSGCHVNFLVSLISSPAVTASFQMTATATNGTVGAGDIDLYAGTSPTVLTLIDSVYSGMIGTGGVNFTGAMQNLLPNTTYYFQLKETVTGSTSSVYSFTTSTFGNQAPQTTGGQNDGSSPSTGTGFDFGNQPGSNPQNGTDGNNQPGNGGPGAPADSGNLNSNYLQNPFVNLNSFPEIFAALYNNILIPVAIPFLVIAIMYSGFLFVVSRKEGKTYKLDQAKSVFKYTMIGAALILGGWVIANALQATFCDIAGNCAPTQTTQQGG